MAKTKSHSADCKTRAVLEALQSDATLAPLATKCAIHLNAWTVRATK